MVFALGTWYSIDELYRVDVRIKRESYRDEISVFFEEYFEFRWIDSILDLVKISFSFKFSSINVESNLDR